MTLLLLGVVLFAAVHLVPSLLPALKANVQAKATENGYKGIFSLLLLAALAMIILGWRSVQPQYLYAPVAMLHTPAVASIMAALLLFVVSNRPSRIKQLVRHPQLTGVALWAFAHLLINGDNRSLVLFGGLLLWAVVEIVAINRRDGVWIKAPVPAWTSDVINVLVTAAVVAVLVMAHPWLAGVPVYW